jgi:hypothetical protein
VTRSLKVEVPKAINAFGMSSRMYNGGRWDCADAHLWFGVIRYVIQDWMKEPTTAMGERKKESAKEFLFGKTPKAKTWRGIVCECAGIHPDSLIRFVMALKTEAHILRLAGLPADCQRVTVHDDDWRGPKPSTLT